MSGILLSLVVTVIFGFFAVVFFHLSFDEKIDENDTGNILHVSMDLAFLEIAVLAVLFICKRLFSKDRFIIAYRIVMFALGVFFSILAIGIWFVSGVLLNA